MSSTIYIIVEGQTDGVIIRKIVTARYPHVRVVALKPKGAHGGVSRLAEQIEELIESAVNMRQDGDCIAVVHDLDNLSRPHGRKDYDDIERICSSEKYRHLIKHIKAVDEIEAWLLADSGLARWLNKRPRNFDSERQPSAILESWLDEARKPKYRKDNPPRFMEHLVGDGDKHSPSLQDALSHLQNAPCTRTLKK